MSTITIADHQTDVILDDITSDFYWDDKHSKSLKDNKETFDFTTFADKRFSEFLSKRNRIIIPDEDGELIELFITNTRRYRQTNGSLLCDVRTSAAFVRLKKAKSIAPHRTDALSAEAHARAALSGTEYEIGTIDFKGVRTFTFEERTNPYSYLHRIASEFGLELHFRVESDGNKITRRYVDLIERVGSWNGREATFGRDLEGIERLEDFNNIVTALIGIGPEREDGTRLEVLVENEDALQRWGRKNQHEIEVYEPNSDDPDMTLSRLRTLTENELEKRINSQVQYIANIVDLANVVGLEHEIMRFGDTIRIKDLKFNPPLYLEARIHTVERSIKNLTRKTVVLGDYIEYTEEDVMALIRTLQKEVNKKIGLGTLEAYAEPVIPEQDTPPSNPKKGDKWVDTSENPPQLKLFDGSEWHAVKGEKGDRGEPGKDGYTPIKGVDYFDGKDGQDGSSSYLWVRYSQNADGNPMSPDPTNAKYIGVATTETPSEPTSPTAYVWSLIKGSDGVPGEDGEDGRTSYLHIKYSNDGGQTFTGNNGEDVGEWIGTYVDFTQADSNNVNDYTWNKVKGEKGDKGDTGPRGATGERGPRGDAGTSVTGVTEYYLASNASSGVTTGTSGWTTSMQQMTPSKKYLWNYEKIHFSDNTSQDTLPVIIGVYGDKGDEGDTGRSIVSIEERYLATSASSGVTRSTSGWTANMQQTTTSKRYLWNYEIITWNKAPLTTYIEPIIIGVHGETGPKGDKGEQGPPGIQGPKGEDGQSQYVHIKYSANANGNPMTTTPQSNSKYIGLANTTSPTAPSSYTAYTWSLIRGADGQDGIPGPKGDDGQTTYTWVRYADDENGSGMSDSPHDKLYIGLAFNKTTPTESNNANDYTWSLMPQNIEIGVKNFLAQSNFEVGSFNYNTGGNVTNDNFQRTIELVPIEPSTEYRITHNLIAEEGTRGIEVAYTYYDSDKNVIRGGSTYSPDVKLDTPDNASFIKIRFGNNAITFEGARYLMHQGHIPVDWTPAPEDVQAEIDVAKGIAEQAQQSADGKNTVYRQSSTPPTTNRKTGDLWFKTNEGNKMFVWTGSWTETKLDYQALAVGKLSAISADLGNVTAGDITGVNISGSKFESAGGEGTISIENDSILNRLGVLFALLKSGQLEVGRETFGGTIDQRVVVSRNYIYYSGQSGSYWGLETSGLGLNITSGKSLTVNDKLLDVIESQGSNSNGEYIRYSNGIQICWNRQSTTTTSDGSFIFTWTLPASFLAGDYFAECKIISSGYHNPGSALQSSVSTATFRGSGLPSNSSYTGALFAIGRWR